MSQSTIFQQCRDSCLPGLNQYLAEDKVLAQGHNKVPGLTLPFAIVAICYKNDRVATDLFHWRKVHFRQIKSPFSPIMVQKLLTSDLYVNT